MTLRQRKVGFGRGPAWKAASALFVVALFAAVVAINMVSRRPLRTTPALMAHRGLSTLAPENTLAAFAAAIELRFDIELDVYESRDGHLVVIHDATVDRTTDGAGPVSDLTLSEIKALDAGSWFDASFAGERVPTLMEVLSLVKQRGQPSTKVAINMKTISPGIELQIAEEVDAIGILGQVFCFAMDEDSNARFKKNHAKIATAVSTNGFSAINLRREKDWRTAVASTDVDALWVNFVPSGDFVEAAHAGEKTVWFHLRKEHSINDFRQACQNGVDGICADDVIALRGLLRKWRASVPGTSAGCRVVKPMTHRRHLIASCGEMRNYPWLHRWRALGGRTIGIRCSTVSR